MTVGITELPPEGMQLGGVALAGDADRGTRTTEGLSLLFTAAGITVQGPQPQIERLLIWSGLDSATCSEQVVLPDGENAAVMELTSGGQSIRFLLPSATVSPGQAAYLDQALPAWLQRYKEQTSAPIGPGTPVPDTAAATAGAIAGVTAARVTAAEAPGDQAPPPPAAPADPPPPPSGSEVPPPPPPPPTEREPAPPIVVTRGNAVVGRPAAGVGVAHNGTNGSPPAAGPGADPSPSTQLPPPPPVPPPAGTDVPLPPPPPPGLAIGLDAPPTAPGHGAATPPAGETLPPSPPKTRGRRRAKREAEQAAAAAVVAPGTSPADPVPLQLPLPPPPPEPRSAETPPPKPKRSRRRRQAEQAATATVAGAAGVAMTDLLSAAPPPPPGVTGLDAPPPGAPVMAPPTPPPATPAGEATAAGGPWGTLASGTEQGDGSGGSGTTVDEAAAGAGGASRSRTGLIVLLVVLLVVVLGGIGYVLVKRHDSSTTPTTVATTPTTNPTAADTALATGVNLRLGDLPTGWVAGSSGTAQPPTVPTSVATVADTELASCLSVPEATIAALFQWSAAEGQTALETSPTFHETTAPGVQMRSLTRTLAASADGTTLSQPFANPNFTTCYGQFQSALYGGAVAGATATVQPVTLAQPSGVRAYGYVTTIALPGGASQVLGQAFLFGGRVETLLEPTTNGVPIPTPAFQSAYQAVSGRVAVAATR